MNLMKNLHPFILCMIGLLCWNQSNAQTLTMSNLQNDLQSIVSELDTSRFRKTNLFLSSSFYYPLIDRMSQTDTVEAFEKRQWYEVANAVFKYNPETIDSIQTIYQKVGSYLENGITPVMVMNYKFDDISSTAYESNLLDTAEDNLHLTRDESPFYQRDLEAIAPGKEFHYYSPRFIFPSNLYFSNKGSALPKIQIQINDGPLHDIQWDKIFDLEQLTGFENASDLIVINTYLHNPFKNKLHKMVIRHQKGLKEVVTNLTDGVLDFNFLKTNETIGPEAKGYASIKLGYDGNGRKHECLTKPLIIVEGIDFGTPENPVGCINGKCGTLGWIDILTGANPDYSQLENGPYFVELLQQKGYDIIYLDWWDGATYMEDNAMVLIKLIQEVNRIKCTDEELVVCGVSMGGQVAKYALSYMESRGMPHCTRTYVSFDSPHKGANIPISLQQFTSLMADASAEADWSLRNKLQRPATRQLLIHHVDVPGKGSDGLRAQFLVHLNDVGNYPKATRNVAIINGSGKKIGMGFKAGDYILSWHNDVRFFHGFASLYHKITGKPSPPPVHMHTTFFASCGLRPWKLSLAMDFKKLSQTIKGYKYAPTECTAIDNAPGGTRSDILGLAEPKRGPESLLGVPTVFINKECFIPSISALDVNTTDYWFDIKSQISPQDPNPIYHPFQCFYAPDDNTEHVRLEYFANSPSDPNYSNIGWFITEIEKTKDPLLPKRLTGTYNFINVRLKGMELEPGSVLRINDFDFSADGSQNKPNEGEHITVQTAQCHGEIRVKSGATLVIGDDNLPFANTADLRITTLSKLILESGSKLVIHNGSKLIIESGAVLQFHPNAEILLEGKNAELQIHGELKLHQAAFKVACSPNKELGFVSFYLGGLNSGIHSQGANSSIELIGQSSANSERKILEIHNGNLQIQGSHRNAAHYVNLFKVHNGIIEYYNNASLEPECTLDLSNVHLLGTSKTESTGLILSGSFHSTITNIRCTQLKTGIQVNNFVSNTPINIENCRFNKCATGLETSGGKLTLSQCSFNQNEKGYYAKLIFGQLSINQCSFFQNENGLDLETRLQNNIVIENSNFAHNNTGIKSIKQYNAVINVRCSQFIENYFGLNVAGKVNLSTTTAFLNETGGHNAFFANTRAIQLEGELYLADGKNLFISDPAKSLNPYVLAKINPCTNCSQFASGGSIITSQNFWAPSYSLVLINNQAPFNSIPALGDLLNDPKNDCFESNADGVPQFKGDSEWVTQLEKNESSARSANSSELKIAPPYPNPTSNIVLVDIRSTEFSLFSANGQLIRSGNFHETETKMIDLKSLESGTYTLKLTIEHDVFYYKILKL